MSVYGGCPLEADLYAYEREQDRQARHEAAVEQGVRDILESHDDKVTCDALDNIYLGEALLCVDGDLWCYLLDFLTKPTQAHRDKFCTELHKLVEGRLADLVERDLMH